MSCLKSNKGFTLIEALVSISIFAMVMLVATGAVFSIVEANKKSHSLKSVMTNLNFALESMSRDIRLGKGYICNQGGSDCINGDIFEYTSNRDVNGDGSVNASDQVKYFLDLGSERIMKKILNQDPFPVTAQEIHITTLKFSMAKTGNVQPKVTIVIRGYAGTGSTRSDFTIQTTVSQRADKNL